MQDDHGEEGGEGRGAPPLPPSGPETKPKPKPRAPRAPRAPRKKPAPSLPSPASSPASSPPSPPVAVQATEQAGGEAKVGGEGEGDEEKENVTDEGAEAGASGSRGRAGTAPTKPTNPRFVYNAFEPPQKSATATAAIGSDDENVILKLNVSNPPLPVEHPHASSAAPFDPPKPPEGGGGGETQRAGAEAARHRSFSPVPSAYNDNDRHHIHGGACCASEGGRGGTGPADEGALGADAPDRMHPMASAASASARPAPLRPAAHSPHSPAPPAPPHEEKCSHQLRKIRLLMEFEEKNKAGEWPASTSIHCYWCCHQFDGPPMGIPLKFVREKFYTYGCFCSLECAAAYNFEHNGSVDERWKRFSLLNMLAARLGHEGVVKQAPDRLALTMFGGHLDIEAFRSHTRTRRLTLVNFPPMQTMTQQVEEINDGDVHCTRPSYIPIPSERVDRFQAKLLLQRKNPVVHHKNTLGRTMDLRFWSSTPPAGGGQ